MCHKWQTQCITNEKQETYRGAQIILMTNRLKLA